MTAKYLCTFLGLFAMLVVGQRLVTGAEQKSGPRRESLNELSMEVAALQTLRQFDFNTAQLQAIQKIARDTSQPAGPLPAAKTSDRFRQVLSDLHAALAKPDADRIGDLQDQLADLRDSENPELDDSWDITETARERAPEVFRLVSARQLVSYLSAYGDQFPDSYELLSEAIDKVRGLNDREYRELRDFMAEEVGRQVGGLNTLKVTQTSEKVTELLIEARVMKEGDFKSRREELLKSAQEIAGVGNTLELIRHSIEYVLAELLSNPRLTSAIDAMSKK
jgi:hypothetical protein